MLFLNLLHYIVEKLSHLITNVAKEIYNTIAIEKVKKRNN